MSVRFRTHAALAAAAILVSGCTGGSGTQLPPAFQPQSISQTDPQAYRHIPALEANLSPTCTWSIVPSTNPTPTFQTLYSVEAVSTTEAWAVGLGPDQKTFALHWNGAGWTQIPTANPTSSVEAHLTSVAEIAPNDVWAVGDYTDSDQTNHSLAEHWDGAHWTLVTTAPPSNTGDPTDLQSVKVISHTNAWAVGAEYLPSTSTYKTFVEHWNGTAWTQVASPSVATTANYLMSLAVVSPSNIWASGSLFNENGIVLHYNGSTWTLSHTTTAHLAGLATASISEVFDVGDFTSNSMSKSYVEKYNGSSWTSQATPNAGSDQVVLNSAAAVSASQVFAVGYHYSTATTQPFAVMWNGTSWVSSQPLTLNSSSSFNAVTAIPGTKDAFAAGYSYNRSNNQTQTLLERAHCV